MIVDRFWAELFRLSSDRSQWNILYPSLLSITVITEVSSRRNGTNYKSLRLLAKNESGIVTEQLLETSNRVTRVSSCFAYWHYHDETYGINVVSADDCDRFCKLIRGDYVSTNSSARDTAVTSSASPTSPLSATILAHIMQIFEVEKGVVKNRNGSFMECVIKLNQNGALIRFKGNDFSLNLPKKKRNVISTESRFITIYNDV
uniref:WH1 domain-containing protein n=1 Tax=Setaria digitata TaxID=48799 RepID=A0A915PKL3_9BILA